MDLVENVESSAVSDLILKLCNSLSKNNPGNLDFIEGPVQTINMIFQL